MPKFAEIERNELNLAAQKRDNVFDKIIRKMRLARVLPSIKAFESPRMLDVGCGFEARLLREVEPFISKGVGIDYKAPKIHTSKLEIFEYCFENRDEIGSASERERERDGFARETAL